MRGVKGIGKVRPFLGHIELKTLFGKMQPEKQQNPRKIPNFLEKNSIFPVNFGCLTIKGLKNAGFSWIHPVLSFGCIAIPAEKIGFLKTSLSETGVEYIIRTSLKSGQSMGHGHAPRIPCSAGFIRLYPWDVAAA